jgi:hypothetical protein
LQRPLNQAVADICGRTRTLGIGSSGGEDSLCDVAMDNPLGTGNRDAYEVTKRLGMRRAFLAGKPFVGSAAATVI